MIFELFLIFLHHKLSVWLGLWRAAAFALSASVTHTAGFRDSILLDGCGCAHPQTTGGWHHGIFQKEKYSS